MEKIASFQVNHLILEPGVYVSRRDRIRGAVLTTYDVRMTAPNKEPVMNTAEVHTLEHLGATFLRNDEEYKADVIYWGPMGCRTGFYLILAGEREPEEIIDLMKRLYRFMAEFEGEVPGACARDCGNYLDMNLPMAKLLAARFLNETLNSIDERHMHYGQ